MKRVSRREAIQWMTQLSFMFSMDMANGVVASSKGTEGIHIPEMSWENQGELYIAGAVCIHSQTTPNSTSILFYASRPARAVISYGIDDRYGHAIKSDKPDIRHEIALANLQPDTIYHYKITVSAENERSQSPDLTFKTARTREQMIEHKGASDIKTLLKVVEITSPGVLDQSNTYYLLTRDIHADNVAFFVGDVKNVVLDLNNYIVSFANTPKTVTAMTYNGLRKGNIAHHGIVFVDDVRYAPDVPLNFTSRGAENVVIKNGTVIQGTAEAGYLTGIMTAGVTSLEIENVHVHMKGPDTVAIGDAYGANVTVHDCLLTTDSRIVTNRQQMRRALWLTDNCRVYGNTIRDYPQVGIGIGNDSVVYNNDIAQKQNAANAYAISCFGASNCRILNNYVHPADGRGLDMTLSKNAAVRWNIFDVHESHTPETDFTHAVRVRYGTTRARIENNFICARGGYGPFGGAYGLRMSENTDVRNEVTHNVVAAVIFSEKFGAAALYVEGDDRNTKDSGDILRCNKIISNDVCVKIGGYNGAYSDIDLTDMVLVRNQGVKRFKSFEVGQYNGPCMGEILTDILFEGGAGFDSVMFEPNSNAAEIIVCWTTKIITIPAAMVTIMDKSGKIFFTGIAGDRGELAFPLVQFIQTPAGKIAQGPYRIKAEKGGKTLEKVINADGKQVVKLMGDL